MKYRRENHTLKETQLIFKISLSTYYEWEKEYDAGFPDKPKRTCEKKIKKQELLKALEEKPDATLAELARAFHCSAVAIFYALKNMGITRKKR